MIYWITLYLVGFLLAFISVMKRLMKQEQVTAQELFYAFVIALFSWGTYFLFDEDFGSVVIFMGAHLSKFGNKVIWRKKKNDKQVPGRDKVAV